MIKKPIALIMGIVLVLTVISSAFLYNQSNRNSGGVTSTNETKYDYIVNDGFGYVKEVYSGARNGELKTVGSVCYEYSKILLNVTPNQTVGSGLTEIVDPTTNVHYSFILDMPLEISITASGVQGYNVYLCWRSETGDPEDPANRHFVGSGSNIIVDEYPPEYGSEYCWIEIESPRGNVTIRRIVVQMVPQADPNGVTAVVATSKNLADYSEATSRTGTPLEIVDNGAVMPAGGMYYIVIPISLPVGTYTASYTGANASGETVGKYCFQYVNGTYSNSDYSGKSITVSSDVKNLFIYKTDPTVALTEDLLISKIQVESGSVATEYTPFFSDITVLSIPTVVQNLPGYGVGSGSLYNYLDLSRGVYVQTCKLDGSEVVALDEPKEYDVSAFLSPGSGAIDLYGVGSLIFVNYYELDVPSRFSYRRIVT